MIFNAAYQDPEDYFKANTLAHLKFNETSGDKVYDAVSGQYWRHTNRDGTPYDYSVPNAVTAFQCPDPSDQAGGGIAWAEFPPSYVPALTSGLVVMFATARYYPETIPPCNPYNPGTLLCLFDTGQSNTTRPVFFLEETGGHTNALIAQDSPNLVAGNGRLGEPPTDPFTVTTYGGPVTYIVAFEIGVPGIKCFLHDGIEFDFNFDTNGDPTTPLQIDNWDVFSQDGSVSNGGTGLEIGASNASYYQLGHLHFPGKSVPSDQTLIDCAAYHNVEAPNGNKVVWPGWSLI